MGHAESYVDLRAGRGGAGAASGWVAVARRAGSGRDAPAVGGGLVAAEDSRPPRVLRRDRPDGAGGVPGDGARRAAPEAPRAAEGPGAAGGGAGRPWPASGGPPERERVACGQGGGLGGSPI